MAAFSDATLYSFSYGTIARADVTNHADQVEGSVQSEWFDARFDAENCGQQESRYDSGDYYYYYYDYDALSE